MNKQHLARAARLARALSEWDEMADALGGKHTVDRVRDSAERGLEISIGDIEQDCGGELVQPDAGCVVDIETGRLIAEAAKKIIEDELRKLGVES